MPRWNSIHNVIPPGKDRWRSPLPLVGGGRLTGCLVMGGMVIFIMRMTLAPPRCSGVCDGCWFVPTKWHGCERVYRKQQMMEDLCGLWFRGLYKLYQTLEIGKQQKPCFQVLQRKVCLCKVFQRKDSSQNHQVTWRAFWISPLPISLTEMGNPTSDIGCCLESFSFHKCCWFVCC